MNVLEEILEEIMQYTKDVYECNLDDIVEYQRRNRDDKCTYIVQGIKEATEFIRSHMDEIKDCNNCSRRKWYQKGYEDGKDTNVSTNDGWIPVSERLPEDGTYLCTLDGELCGIDEPFTGMCGIENGKWDEEGCVIAWQPLPAPYKGELNPKDIPHTCDTCRRYGKSDHNCYYCRHKERPDLWESKEDIHE